MTLRDSWKWHSVFGTVLRGELSEQTERGRTSWNSTASTFRRRNWSGVIRPLGYRVVRMWGEEPEPYLSGGVNLVPLAPLTKVRESDLPAVVRRMDARISAQPRPEALKLWTATYLLMGLCYSEDVVSQLLQGVVDMPESTTYQAILREGRVKGEQQLLVRQGTKRFGKPDAATVAAIEAIRDIERLDALGERIVDPDVRDWGELLQAS
jgi:hypothetical protein